MDAVAGLLDGPRAREAFLLRAVLSSPWSIEIRDEAPVTVMAATRGTCWLVAGDARWQLSPGDVAVVQGPAPYLVADDPDRAPTAVIEPGQVCRAPDGGDSGMGFVGPRSWGNDASGSDEILIGTYDVAREVSHRLLAALPRVLVLTAGEWDCPLLPVLADELTRDRIGQGAVLDRLLDLVLVSVLRAWLDRETAPAWYRAYDDPLIGPAVRHLQAAPERAWTLRDLAATVGVSRATLARRFADAVGQSPMAFLTGWRVSLAADLLRESDDTLDAIARRVGYGSAFALSAAFKRERGMSPRDYRRGVGSRAGSG